MTARARAVSTRRSDVGLLAGAAVGLLACVPVLWVLAEDRRTLPGERALAERWFDPVSPQYGSDLADAFLTLGTPAGAAACLLVAAVICARLRGPRLAVLVLATSGAAVLARGIKAALGTTTLYTDFQPAPTDGNLPSGHVAFAAALFGLLAALAWRAGHRVLAVVLAAPIATTGAASIRGGAHLLSDVVAGLALGAAWVAGTLLVARRLNAA